MTGHGQLLGQGLQAHGDLRDFLHAVGVRAQVRAGDQLQVVDDDQVQADLALQATGPGGQLGDRDAAGGVDIERGFLQLDGRVADPAELAGVDLALAELVARHAGRVGQHTQGQLLGAHFQRVEGHDAAADGLLGAVRLGLPGVLRGHVEGDVGGQRRLAHRRAAGQHDQVGGVQAADLGVQVDQVAGQARHAAVAAVGLGGHLDRAAQGVAEADETGAGRAALGQGVELLFGRLDLVAGRQLDVVLADAAVGGGGDLAADADQVAAQGQVEDRAGVVADIGGGRGAVDQVGQVAQAAQFLEGRIVLELVRQQDGLGQLALADMGLDRLEQPLVEGLVEVAALQAVGQALIGRVVVQQHAQQRLFGLQVVRRDRDDDIAHRGGWAKIQSRDEGHCHKLTRSLPARSGRVAGHARWMGMFCVYSGRAVRRKRTHENGAESLPAPLCHDARSSYQL